MRLCVAECPHTAWRLGSKIVHSKHRGEDCGSFMAEPWELHSVTSTTSYWSKELPGQPRLEGRGSKYHLSNGGVVKNVQPCLILHSLFPAHKLLTFLLQTKYSHCLSSPPPTLKVLSHYGIKVRLDVHDVVI